MADAQPVHSRPNFALQSTRPIWNQITSHWPPVSCDTGLQVALVVGSELAENFMQGGPSKAFVYWLPIRWGERPRNLLTVLPCLAISWQASYVVPREPTFSCASADVIWIFSRVKRDCQFARPFPKASPQFALCGSARLNNCLSLSEALRAPRRQNKCNKHVQLYTEEGVRRARQATRTKFEIECTKME